MKIVLLSEDSIRIEADAGPMTINALSDELSYSAFHMLGGALGYCTLSVLYTWATSADMSADDLAVEVDWTFVEDPQRVDTMRLRYEWPTLPPDKVAAAKRVAELCAVHATLQEPPRITVEQVTSTSESRPHTSKSGLR